MLTPAQIKPESFESRGNFFSTRGGCVSCLRECLGARLLPQSHQSPNLSEGADRVGGQLRGDKECPFCGVTTSGRVWRKVPESDARSVQWKLRAASSLEGHRHTPSIAFRHLPPNSTRFSYATEGALFVPSTHVNMRRIPPRVKREFRLDSNDFGFILSWRKQHGQL